MLSCFPEYLISAAVVVVVSILRGSENVFCSAKNEKNNPARITNDRTQFIIFHSDQVFFNNVMSVRLAVLNMMSFLG